MNSQRDKGTALAEVLGATGLLWIVVFLPRILPDTPRPCFRGIGLAPLMRAGLFE